MLTDTAKAAIEATAQADLAKANAVLLAKLADAERERDEWRDKADRASAALILIEQQQHRHDQ